MKRAIPIALALAFIVAACGSPAPEATPSATLYPASPQDLVERTPEPTEDPRIPQEPAVLAGPADEGYTFTSDTQHFSIEIPDEAAPYVLISDGRPWYIPVGEAVSFLYYSHEYESDLGTFGSIMAVPREDYFNPARYYNEDYHGVHGVVKASREYIYVDITGTGGYDLPIEPLEGQSTAGRAVGFNALKENLIVPNPDGLPVLERESLPEAAAKLDGLGNATMTRGEAAVFVVDMLTADNKDTEYPLRFTDVTPGTDEARAIAYLDSYGIFAQYTDSGERVSDGDVFRPDEPITRAEFAQLLQRVQFVNSPRTYIYPYWFYLSGNVPLPASDIDDTHWAYDEINCAYYDGWYEVTNGKIRPDEPVTAGEMAVAMTALYRELVRYNRELPTVDYEDERTYLCGSSDSSEKGWLKTDGYMDIEHFTCWYSYVESGRLICGKVDETQATLTEENYSIQFEDGGYAKYSVTLPDGHKLYFRSWDNVSDIALWQSMPFNHESAANYASGTLRGITPGTSANEVVARFPSERLYSCMGDGYIYGSAEGAYGLIGTDAYGRYIQYSDGESRVRFDIDANGCVESIEYLTG